MLSKSLFMMLHIFIWKDRQEKMKQENKGKRKMSNSAFFFSDDPFAVRRERGWSNVELLFAAALINSARYLWAQKRPSYFRVEMEQWGRRRRKGKGDNNKKVRRRKRESRLYSCKKQKINDRQEQLSIICISAEVIAQVIYVCWINARPTAQVNIVTDI